MSHRFGAMLACCFAASAVLAGPASAGQIFRESFHGEGTFVAENFCGVSGLTVEESAVIDVTVQAVQRGPDGSAYFLEHHKETSVLTNLASGNTVTFVRKSLTAKDLKTTDNGDGTLTTVFLLTGNDVLYGVDGKAVARDPGEGRLELVIDHGGTPTDPSDDQLISREVVKGSTGRTDDPCTAAVEALSQITILWRGAPHQPA